MSQRKKLFSSFITLGCLVFAIIFAISLTLWVGQAEKNAMAYSFKATGVEAEVSGNYYVGQTKNKMLSGTNEKIIFGQNDQESFEPLNPAGEIKLSSRNDFVVFEYEFKNQSSKNSFAVSMIHQIESTNMDISYAYSYEKLNDFNECCFDRYQTCAVYKGDNTLYLYIKLKISNLNLASSLNGIFCFSLTETDVYNVYLIDGEIRNKTYVAYGYELNDIKIPNMPGMVFKGYYDKPFGLGTKYIDENGKACFVWQENNDKILYAHYATA